MRLVPYYHLKIKDKIFSIMLLLLVIFGIAGIISFQYFSKMYEDEIYKQSAETLQLSSAVLDKELNEMEKLSFQISTDNFVQQSLKAIKRNETVFELYRTKSMLIDDLVSFATQERYISSIQIIDDHGVSYLAGFDTKIKINVDEIIPLANVEKGANVWTHIENQNKIIAARSIRRKENISLENLGTLLMTIDMNKLIRGSLKVPADNNFVIVGDDEVIYMSDENELNNKRIPDFKNESGYEIIEIEGKDYLVAFQDSEFSNLTYYHFLPFDYIKKQTTIIKRWMILYVILMVLLTIFLSRRAASELSKPIEELTKKMKQLQKGRFEVTALEDEKYSEDEVGQLHKNFQIMVNKINVLIKENYEKQLIIKETEYRALQAQINPHFLYNTLDSINWIAKINKQPNISSMAEALGNMMREIISKKEPLIQLKDELQIITNYITIQKFRYHERLHFRLNCAPGIEHYLIPKLSIQPIVENAIQYGVETSISGCEISIDIRASNEELMIVIEDDGPGIDKMTVQSIFTGKIKPRGTGIGLGNINERIKLMFGNAYGIKIDSQLGKGAKVTITIPCRMG